MNLQPCGAQQRGTSTAIRLMVIILRSVRTQRAESIGFDPRDLCRGRGRAMKCIAFRKRGDESVAVLQPFEKCAADETTHVNHNQKRKLSTYNGILQGRVGAAKRTSCRKQVCVLSSREAAKQGLLFTRLLRELWGQCTQKS